MINEFLADIQKYQNDILAFITEGEVNKEYLPYLYNLFVDNKYPIEVSRKLTYELLLSIKKHQKMQDIRLLANVLGISEDEASLILSSEMRIFQIVVVSENNVGIINGIVINCDIDINAFPYEKPSIKDSLSNLSKALDRKFFVAFEKYFVGNSFMLALAACVMVGEKIFERYLFTGDVKADGSVLCVNDISQKKAFALQQNKVLCSYEQFGNIKELYFFIEKEINVPFIQLFGKDRHTLEANFSYMSSTLPYFETFKKLYDLRNDDFCVYDASMLPLSNLDEQNFWVNYLIESKSKIKKIYELDNRARIHLLGSLSTYMFALGVILGIKKGVDLYHYIKIITIFML